MQRCTKVREVSGKLTPGWIVIHLARSEQRARVILQFLQDESFLARYRRVTSSTGKPDCFEILVPSGEAAEAQQLLIEHNLLR